MDDEVWLFGFSRGACEFFCSESLWQFATRIDIHRDVVRAVAGLFQHIRAINSPKYDFEEAYKEGLKIHRDIKWGNGFKRPGTVSQDNPVYPRLTVTDFSRLIAICKHIK